MRSEAAKRNPFQAIVRWFTPEGMVPEKERVGPLPATKDAYQKAFRVAWPSAVESVFIGLVGVVDTIMVSSLGTTAISAVGITGQPRMLMLALFFALNVGVTALVSRRTGEQDRLAANRAMRQVLLLCIGFGVVFTFLSVFFARPLLMFAGANNDIIDDAVIYFQIIMGGLLINILTMCINAAQRGAGNTRISMRTNVAANVVNVIFNYLLINGRLGFPKLGVAGAALATVIGSFVGFLMAVASLMHRDGWLSLRLKTSWAFDKRVIQSVFKVSSSAMVEQVFLRIGFLLYVKIVAALGTDLYAVHQICMNILGLSFTFGDGFSAAGSALAGQSLGAKRSDLAMMYGKTCQRIGMCISILLSIVFFALAPQIVGLYTREADLIAIGTPIIYVITVIVFAQIQQVIMAGCLRGAGDTRFVAVVAMVCIMVIRPVLSYLLCYTLKLGLLGAWLGIVLDQYMRLILTMWRFSSGKWKSIQV